LLILLLLAGTFMAGFYLGASGNKQFQQSYANLKEEMTVKTRGLEGEISSMRARLNLVEARDFLGLAKTDIQNKNYGDAEFKIKKAEERVDKAISLSPDAQKKKLLPFQAKIGEIRQGIQKRGTQIGNQIEAVEKDLEKITG
jgi:hypothetical protein